MSIVSAIIINYYTSSLLSPLLERLEQDDYVKEIIIIDNSQEASILQFEDSINKVYLIRNQNNVGFGVAVNQGVSRATGQYALIINPDVRLFADTIDQLLQAAQTCHSPIAGPRFYWDEDRIFKLPPSTGSCWWWEVACQCAVSSQPDAELLSFYWSIRHDRFWEKDHPFFEPFLSGACLLVETSWIERQKDELFDQRFFMYFEDTDLCLRAILNKTFPICAPRARAIHYWNQSPQPSESKEQLMKQSSDEFWLKYYGKKPDFSNLFFANGLAKDLFYLGEYIEPPIFSWPNIDLNQSIFFEFGVNPCLVPFAQAQVDGTSFNIPKTIWQRLKPGEYYCRVRDQLRGTLKRWRWKKIV